MFKKIKNMFKKKIKNRRAGPPHPWPKPKPKEMSTPKNEVNSKISRVCKKVPFEEMFTKEECELINKKQREEDEDEDV